MSERTEWGVAADPTNPGQFFACCGLLELADRLWPGAEGWFAADGREFRVACGGTLREVLTLLGRATLTSSVGDDGLKRLGTLKSQEKTSLTAQDEADKERLNALWKVERVILSVPADENNISLQRMPLSRAVQVAHPNPVELALTWWWDGGPGMKTLKTWAAKQFVLYIARPMLDAVRLLTWDDDALRGCLTRTAKLKGLPFYFDAANNTQNTRRDNGFAPEAVKPPAGGVDRPLIELLAFVGLQRFRPIRPAKSPLIRYTTWSLPLRPAVAAATAAGALGLPGDQTYVFQVLFRSEYMKAFLPAQLSRGGRDE